MDRDFRLFLFDIIDAINKIEKYLVGYTQDTFFEDELIQDAVVRRLEIIGEAVKHIPDHIKQEFPDVAWKKAAGFRDVVVHNYFGIDTSITWDTAKQDLPEFSQQIQTVLSKYPLEQHD